MSHISREFVKILFQKRTYFGWAGLFLMPFIITAASAAVGRRPPAGGTGRTSVLRPHREQRALLVAVASLFALVTFLLPLLAAMSGSQTIAGEAENGHAEDPPHAAGPPGSGARSPNGSSPTSTSPSGSCCWPWARSSPAGPSTASSPSLLLTGQTVGVGESIWLIFLAYLFVLVGMATVVSLSVAFSTLTNSSLTAVGAALVLVIIMLVLGSLSVFDFLQPYLFTSHFDAWINLFREPIVWGPIRDALINFAVWIVGMTGVAYLIFRRKDVLS